MSNICVTNDVVLKDNLFLDAEERVIVKNRNSGQIEGYPSPQKLKSLYDSVTAFEEMRGDLFSLGLTALQLFDLNEDISMLYVNPNPVYRNFSFDLQRLHQLVKSILHAPLRNAI